MRKQASSTTKGKSSIPTRNTFKSRLQEAVYNDSGERNIKKTSEIVSSKKISNANITLREKIAFYT